MVRRFAPAETQTDRGNHALGNVNVVKEVAQRDITAQVNVNVVKEVKYPNNTATPDCLFSIPAVPAERLTPFALPASCRWSA